MATRVAVATIAVLVLGWLVVLERDTRHYARGVALGGRLNDRATVAEAEEAFKSARLLNPDTAPDVGRALVLRGAGRAHEARILLQSVLRREPDNLSAWTALGWAGGDEERVAAALRRLDPIGARRGPRR